MSAPAPGVELKVQLLSICVIASQAFLQYGLSDGGSVQYYLDAARFAHSSSFQVSKATSVSTNEVWGNNDFNQVQCNFYWGENCKDFDHSIYSDSENVDHLLSLSSNKLFDLT
jgi:hypothetical protein